MRCIFTRICALMSLTACLAAPVRGADPQPYKVDLASTGDGAMDSTLRGTSDLISLRSSGPVGPYGLIARARGDVDRLKTVLESYGYYESKVVIKIDGLALTDPTLGDHLTSLPKKHDAQIRASFTPGPLYHIRNITIDGELPPFAQGELPLKSGVPAVASTVLGAGAHLLTVLEDQGYAFAKVDPPVAYEDRTDPILDVTFHVETGAKVNVGEIHFRGLKRVHEKILRQRLLLHTGDLFRASEVERARADLLHLPVFASVSVQVGAAVDDTGGVPVTFRFRERPRHTIAVNAAYSTDLGGSGGINWGDRNVFGNAEQLNISTSLINVGGSSTNGLGYNAGVKYILPDFGHRDQSLQFAVSALKQYLIAYDQTAVSAGVTLTRQLNRLWTVSAGMTATQETVNQVVGVIASPETVDGKTQDVEEADYQLFHYTLVALPLTVSYDSTNLASPLDDPTHGMRDSVSIAPTHALGHSNSTFLVTTVKAAVYLDLDRLFQIGAGRSVIAVRALVGSAEGAGVCTAPPLNTTPSTVPSTTGTKEAVQTCGLPPDQRFYGGGSASIRGYPYQGVGPYFPDTNDPIGATTISAAGLEFRQRFGQNWGAAVFVDGGQVGNKISLSPTDLFYGVGGGVRYYTPIGPVRLDVAVPLRRYDSDPEAFQIYIGLGQAF
jgi:translocation and assembly module TamA